MRAITNLKQGPKKKKQEFLTDREGERVLTILFKIAARIDGIELRSSSISIARGGRRRKLEGLDLDEVRSASSDTKQVGIGDEAERVVVLDNGTLIVPLGIGIIHEGSELRRDSEGRFEDARVLLRQSYLHLRP